MEKSNRFSSESDKEINSIGLSEANFSYIKNLAQKHNLDLDTVIGNLIQVNEKVNSFVNIYNNNLFKPIEPSKPITPISTFNRFEIVDKILKIAESSITGYCRIQSHESGQFGNSVLLEQCSDPHRIYNDRIIVEVFETLEEFGNTYEDEQIYRFLDFDIKRDTKSKIVVYFQSSFPMSDIFTESYLKSIADKLDIAEICCVTGGEQIDLYSTDDLF